MKTKPLLALTLLAFASTSGFAQPQLSLGVTGGLQVYPTHGNTFLPLLGASAWFKANKLFFLSGEYLRYQGVDLYPTATSGLLPARVHENSHTQRAAVGLHYLVKTYNTSSIALLGINFGQSWDKRGYQLYEPTAQGNFNFRGTGEDQLQRPVLFASLTAQSQNKKFPFFFQTRYGFSFSDFSSLSFVESKTFWQVLAGVHLKIL
ncbi:hypothetical protein L0337_25230 [candidate division KSB1 bacterium]|nr:hypothetical protein [candidate division KSB1 bacterium]